MTYDIEVQYTDGEVGEYTDVQVSVGQVSLCIIDEERELFIPYTNIFYFSKEEH